MLNGNWNRVDIKLLLSLPLNLLKDYSYEGGKQFSIETISPMTIRRY